MTLETLLNDTLICMLLLNPEKCHLNYDLWFNWSKPCLLLSQGCNQKVKSNNPWNYYRQKIELQRLVLETSAQ